MNQQQPELLEEVPLPEGTISGKCRVVKTEGLHIVMVRGVEMFIYDPSDKLAKRTVWVQVCENGYALRWQVAKELRIGLRTLQYWIARYREEGASGLVDKAKSGAPRKVTAALEKRILRLRAERGSVREIAAKCRLSIGAVHKILAKHGESSAGCQMELSAAEELILEECELAETAAEEDGPREEPQRREVRSTCSLPEETEAQEAEDRSLDRVMARLGLLDDAPALFAPGENVSWAGVMMAAVVLSTSPFLSLVKKSYGSIGPAFYGLRTVMMSYVSPGR